MFKTIFQSIFALGELATACKTLLFQMFNPHQMPLAQLKLHLYLLLFLFQVNLLLLVSIVRVVVMRLVAQASLSTQQIQVTEILQHEDENRQI